MSDALRKGWCPGALRPMMARDGLLVRLRLTGGRLDAEHARAIAALAEFYGNGLLDLSARANLQMRGVAAENLPNLLDALADLALLDDDAAGEAVRNVMISPLAGLSDKFDVRPIASALERRLVADPALHALPAKFGFLIDDGGEPTLAGIAADVRFEIVASDLAPRAWIGLGGTRDHAVPLGLCGLDEVVDVAAGVARAFLSLAGGGQPAIRRMAQLVERLGAYQTAKAFGAAPDAKRLDYAGAIFQRPPVGLVQDGALTTLGLAVPFGRLDHGMLRAAADLSERDGLGEVRLTPWRCLLVPGIDANVDVAACRAAGFIVDPDRPVLRVAACVGQEGCERGTTSTHADAEALLDLVERAGAAPIAVHLSGCEKGCAKATRSPLTLVGRAGRYDVVYHGKASETPTRQGLDLAAVRALLARMAPA